MDRAVGRFRRERTMARKVLLRVLVKQRRRKIDVRGFDFQDVWPTAIVMMPNV